MLNSKQHSWAYPFWKRWLLAASLRTAIFACLPVLVLSGILDNVKWLYYLYPEGFIPALPGEIIAIVVFGDTLTVGYFISGFTKEVQQNLDTPS